MSLATNAFTAEELENLKCGFKNIDTSGDGYVSEDEFNVFAKEVGLNEVIAPAIFFYFDNPEKGITFEQFVEFMALYDDIENDAYHFAKIIFDKLDKDASGTIDREEMFKFCKIFHLKETDEEVNKLIETIDSDGSGDISFEELLKAFTE